MPRRPDGAARSPAAQIGAEPLGAGVDGDSLSRPAVTARDRPQPLRGRPASIPGKTKTTAHDRHRAARRGSGRRGGCGGGGAAPMGPPHTWIVLWSLEAARERLGSAFLCRGSLQMPGPAPRPACQ